MRTRIWGKLRMKEGIAEGQELGDSSSHIKHPETGNPLKKSSPPAAAAFSLVSPQLHTKASIQMPTFRSPQSDSLPVPEAFVGPNCFFI
ncbi:hypothetical protein E5288_WYG013526 [Bos mutus]|uniref:Uncharacterized protein n=1 Tax=Bos mutus TaxID=72004 RepID=A0A6B0QU38_9CETA|nr:hypothetical protein [Bos mutus]